MRKQFVALVLGAALIGSIAACSSSNNATTTTTAAAGGGTTTSAKAGGTGTSAKPSTPKVTKPEKIDTSKIDQSKIPGNVKTAKNLDLTQDESDCITYVIYLTYENTPDLGTDDATAAGVAGASIVACVPKDKIAAGIVAEMKKGAPSLTDAQASCVENDIKSADDDSLALFIAALAYGSDELLKPFVDALAAKCA